MTSLPYSLSYVAHAGHEHAETSSVSLPLLLGISGAIIIILAVVIIVSIKNQQPETPKHKRSAKRR